ncbi:MAG: ANTAR domain-containing protein [Marmoricola sp.]
MSYAEEESAQPLESFSADIDSLLAARAAVEQAKGILMERYSISDEAAFAVLRRHSQNSNRKLREVAQELVVTRRLPEDPTVTSKGPSGHSMAKVRPPPALAA